MGISKRARKACEFTLAGVTKIESSRRLVNGKSVTDPDGIYCIKLKVWQGFSEPVFIRFYGKGEFHKL